MRVTIVGAGNMGRGMGTRAVAGGHQVEILDATWRKRRGSPASSAAPRPRWRPERRSAGRSWCSPSTTRASRTRSSSTPSSSPARSWSTSPTPSTSRPGTGWPRHPGTSSAEEVQRLVPQGTPVVKAFNTTFAGTLVEGEVDGQQLDVLIAGDDQAAKQQVSQLVSDGGLRPIDVGPLSRAQQLEHLGLLHISLQQPLGLGFGSAIRLHP